MKKVKAILPTFFHSFVPQDIFYPKLLHTRFNFSLKYFLVFIVVASYLLTLLVFVMYPPNKIISYKKSIIQSLSTFPADVVLRIKNGSLETNLNKPFFLWIYRDNKPLFVFMAHGKDDLTFANTPLPIVFLGNDKIQFSFKGTAFMQLYDKKHEYLISKDTFRSFITLTDSLFPPLLFFFYLFMFTVLPLVFSLWAAVLILLNALISFAILRLFIPHLHLKKCIQAGMHGTHIPVIVTIILLIMFPTSANVIIISNALMFVFTLVAIYEMYSKSLAPHHAKGR